MASLTTNVNVGFQLLTDRVTTNRRFSHEVALLTPCFQAVIYWYQ